MRQIADETFQNEVINSPDLVLVEFWAPWCGPCRVMAPVLEELDKEYDGKPIVIAKLNVDDNTSSAQRFGIMSIPTLLFFRGGNVAGQIVGSVSIGALRSKIDALI